MASSADRLLAKARRLSELGQKRDVLDGQLQEIKDHFWAFKETYENAWMCELARRMEETGLSFCTWCNAVSPVEEMVDAFNAEWHSDHYDPAPFWRTLTWHRLCAVCQAKKSHPRLAPEYAAYAAAHPEGPMFVEDDRAKPPYWEVRSERGRRLGLPPSPDEFRRDSCPDLTPDPPPVVKERSRASLLTKP